MTLARSRLTAQGQISIPVDVRQKLGIGAGSILEWDEEDGKIVVRRAARFSSEDIHRAIFPDQAPATRTIDEMKQGIKQRMRERYARR